MAEIEWAEVTYKVRVAKLPGVELPEKVKTVSNWLPTRHGVVLNEYMRWIRDGHNSKQEFAKNLVKRIENGEFPILERNEFDDDPKPITYQAIMSQIDWWAQKENQVITYAKDSTEKIFHPNNLMLLTTKQKAEEARRSREKQVVDDKLVETLKSLAPEARKELIEILS